MPLCPVESADDDELEELYKVENKPEKLVSG